MALLLVGLLPLAFAADLPYLRGVTLIFDLLVVTAAAVDFVLSRRMLDDLRSERETGPRLAVGESREVRLSFENLGDSALRLTIRDEYPPEMRLDTARETAFTLPAKGTALFSYRVTPTRQGGYVFGRTAVRCLSRLRLVTIQRTVGEESLCEVFPNLGRARALELGALGAQSFVAVQRRAARRGEGREFESLRDYVLGDELRHISWTATARRSKLTTRQYQIERDQNVIVALDAGRMMTGVIDDETKFETALHAGLALMSAAARAGDNFGLVLFGRNIRKYVPPGKGVSQFDAVLEALYDAEPEPVEPSYARAFKFIAANTKRRSFIAVMTDLVDKDSSKELIASMKLLRPRHLPLVAAVADRDLSAVVSEAPEDARQMFVQSAAQEVIRQREAALRVIETQGGLTLDVTTRTLALNLLQKYLKVKERGLL
jgi:uncharacterized protein (DUF58 family)